MVHESNTNIFYATMSEMTDIQQQIIQYGTPLPFNFGDKIYVVDQGYWLIVGDNNIYEYLEPNTANTPPY